jgi:hypothetical protein
MVLHHPHLNHPMRGPMQRPEPSPDRKNIRYISFSILPCQYARQRFACFSRECPQIGQ